MESLLSGNVIFHYKSFRPGDTAARMAIESPHQGGWAALGFSADGSMVGTPAVVATTRAANGGIGVFYLGGTSADAVTEYPGSVAGSSGGRRLADTGAEEFTITDASVERAGGRLVARFSRAFDGGFSGQAPFPAIFAFYSSDAELMAAHEMRGAADLSLTGDGAVVKTDDTARLRRWHAALMLLSWGVLLPLGVIIAATLRGVGPKSMWFQLHRGIQVVGLLLASVGFVIAVARFDSLPPGDPHKRLGIVVMVLGWLQPLNALVRPHPPEDGEKRSALRCVWVFLHRGLGWAAISLAISTIIKGLYHAETFEGLRENHTKYRNGYIAAGVSLAVLFLVLLVIHFVRLRWQCRQRQGADGQYVKSSDTAVAEEVHGAESIRPDSP